MWRDLFVLMPEYEWGTTAGVYWTFEQLHEAVCTLRDEIPPEVSRERLALLRQRQEWWAGICNMVEAYHASDSPWDSELVARASSEPDLNLRQLADQTWQTLSTRVWCELGMAIGDYQGGSTRPAGKACRSCPAAWSGS
jgi:hypothetical protein